MLRKNMDTRICVKPRWDTNICVRFFRQFTFPKKKPLEIDPELREWKVDQLRNHLVYNVLKTLTEFKRTNATLTEVEQALAFLPDMDIDKLMEHYIHILVKKAPRKLSKSRKRRKWYQGEH